MGANIQRWAVGSWWRCAFSAVVNCILWWG